MKLFIPKDAFMNPKPPRLFLCTTGKKKIGQLKAYDISLDGKWNTYSTFSFTMDHKYVDMITGETKVDPLFDKAEGLRKVYAENIGYFVIQDPDSVYSDRETKTLSCFSAEYETSNKYLENFRINTGEIDSAEVMYNETIHGYDYVIDKDKLYKPASGVFNPYEIYYIKKYTDATHYTWEQIQVEDSADYNSHFGSGVNKDFPLYVKNYPNVRFYDKTKEGLSLLHIIFKHIPDWKIGHVDASLWREERTFSEDRISVYDFLMSDITDTFKCVVEWDTLTNTVNFYEEAEDGVTDDNTVQTRFDTDVYISRENLANEINIKYSTDNIKTKLKVSGSDNLDIREVNLGKNYIMNLGFYHTIDWMEDDLYSAYSKYLEVTKEYSPLYNDVMQKWVAANNRWNDIVNEIPAEGNVVLVGDQFQKLYCIHSPADTAYYNGEVDDNTTNLLPTSLYVDKEFKDNIPTPIGTVMYVVQGVLFVYNATTKYFERDNSTLDVKEKTLIDQLNLYHVDEDINANKQDNILLRLKNANDDVATIRIYDPKKLVDTNAGYDSNASYYVGDDNTSGTMKYNKVKLDGSTFATFDKSTLYTNDYKIQVVVVSATNGLSMTYPLYTLDSWLKGDLNVDNTTGTGLNNLKDYTVSYIGTMGAYFVLAKDEKQKENIRDYGVNLLKEKHKVYTTIFQTQTEAMYSQKKYQCVVSNIPPVEPVPDETRWLDSDSNPAKLYAYNKDMYYEATSYVEGMTYYVGSGNNQTIASPQPTVQTFNNGTYYTHWDLVEPEVSLDEQLEYENYQRYIDNYDKLKVIQEVLVEKERIANYCLNGYVVPNRTIPVDNDLEQNMTSAAQAHFQGYTIRKKTFEAIEPLSANIPISQTFPNQYLYTFTTSFDGYANVYAVYLKEKIPYVAYLDSQGIHQMKLDRISNATEFSMFFNDDQWARLSPFIREDEFSDDNFLLTGYESEEDRLKICKELVASANKELNTLCQPSLEFSMNMANIFALPEFQSLIDKDQFALGNFVRIRIREGYVKRSRLLEVHINFSDLSDFSANFGNLITTKSEIDKHAELLSQAVTAGKQVAVSSGSWQKAVDKSNKLEQDIANGLRDAALEVGKASGQSIVWDASGIWGRKLVDGTTDQYEPEQFRMINNKLVFSNDNFETSKSVFGKYTVNGEERWGVLAEYITADTVEGKFIKGGKIQIGDETKPGGSVFIVNEDGSVEMRTNGVDTYATSGDVSKVQTVVDVISQARQYRTELTYHGPTVFSDPNQSCIITCNIYNWDTLITDKIISSNGTFSWVRNSNSPNEDDTWNNAHANISGIDANKITITHTDVAQNAQFTCSVEFNDEILKEGE
jgi:hypothetical protein